MSKVYTTLDAPIELRRNLLRSNIKVIEMLEDLEKLRELKVNKYKTFLFLKAYMKEIHSSINSLRMKFPHIQFDEEEELKKEVERVDVEFDSYIKKDSEVDKLEKELFILQEKLREVE